MQNFTQASAQSMLSMLSAKANSGSIIQNSAKCLVELEVSALKVGEKVYTLDKPQAQFSKASQPDTVKKAGLWKKSLP